MTDSETLRALLARVEGAAGDHWHTIASTPMQLLERIAMTAERNKDTPGSPICFPVNSGDLALLAALLRAKIAETDNG